MAADDTSAKTEKSPPADTEATDQKATPEDDADRIQTWIEQLGSSDYATRKAAQENLLSSTFEAYEALRESANSTNIEVAAQSQYLLQRMQFETARPSDSPAVKAILQDYMKQNGTQRAERIKKLSMLKEPDVVSALCRVMRLEQSEILSKKAALAVITRELPKDLTAQSKVGPTILRDTKLSRREAANWLLSYARTLSDANKALQQWNVFLDKEREQLDRISGKKTDLSNLSMMYDYKIRLLKQLDREDDVTRTIIEQLKYETDPRAAVIAMALRLLDEKKLDIAGKLVEQFKDKYSKDSDFLFVSAELAYLRGETDEVKRLLAIIDTLGPAGRISPYQTAVHLRSRGLYDWAEREYRRAIDSPAKITPGMPVFPGMRVGGVNIPAYFGLAELYFDGAEYTKAAETLQALLVKNKEKTGSTTTKFSLPGGSIDVNQRIAYYHGMAAGKKKDYKAEKTHLENALKLNPEDTEVLIALYHNPELDKDTPLRLNVKKLIEKFIDERATTLKRARAQFPKPEAAPPETGVAIAMLSNQMAWVMIRTEGDIDKAIEASEMSLKIMPDTSAYLDTLAHCYHKKGDIDKAIECQKKACSLSPHERVLQRNLKRFEESAGKAKEEKAPVEEPVIEQEEKS